MAAAQREHADLLSGGTWTPLVDLGVEAAAAGVYGSLFEGGDRALLALVNRGAEPFVVSWRGAEVKVPGRGLAGLVRMRAGRCARRGLMIRVGVDGVPTPPGRWERPEARRRAAFW